MDSKFLGKKYGPFHYEVGVEKVREFAMALAGGVPSSAFPAESPLVGHYTEYPAVAPPTFAAVYNIQPFAAAIFDPELDINMMMLVHGEQGFTFVRPVKPGDSLNTEGEITQFAEKAGKKFLSVKSTTRDAKGDVVTVGDWMAVIRG